MENVSHVQHAANPEFDSDVSRCVRHALGFKCRGRPCQIHNLGTAVEDDPVPDIILVPVCITSEEKESVLYHLELKNLELRAAKYTKAVAQIRRKAEPRRMGQLDVEAKAKVD